MVTEIKAKKIGIVSDTHGSLPAWNKAMAMFAPVDAVIHAGDVLYHGPRNTIPGGYTPADLAEAVRNFTKPLFIARGNCDADVDMMVTDREMPKMLALKWGNKKILVMHGDNYPLFKQMAIDNEVDLAISGHTHIPMITKEGNTIFLNPGSTTIPKGVDPASAAVIDEDGVTVYSLDGKVLYRANWK